MKSNNKQSGTLAGHHNQPAGPITERYKMETKQLKRIADAMEEILRLVKEDQAQSQAQREKDEEEQSWPTGLGKAENEQRDEEEDDDQGNTAIITEERMNEKN